MLRDGLVGARQFRYNPPSVMEFIRTLWHAIPDPIRDVVRALLLEEGVIKYVTGLFALVSASVALAKAWWHFRSKADETSAWFRKYFEEVRPSNLTRSAALDAFYGFSGAPQMTPLVYAISGIPLKRSALPRICELIRTTAEFRRIHIDGGRNEGKTTLLAQIAVSIHGDGDTLIAFHNDTDAERAGLDADRLITHWRRSPYPLLHVYRKKHLLVLLDELVPLNDHKALADRRESFISQLQSAATSRHRITVVTASNKVSEPHVDPIHLQLEQDEPFRLLEHLVRDGIIDVDLTPRQMIGRIGGATVYRTSLKAFLASALMLREDVASPLLRMDDLSDTDVPELKYAIAVIAACQVLDIEVPATLLPSLVQVPHDKLMGDTRAWIRMRPITFLGVQRLGVQRLGAAMTAPHLATLVFREGRITGEHLINLYGFIFHRTIESGLNTDIHREFLRHILHRLHKQERIRIAGVEAKQIAHDLDQLFDASIGNWIAHITSLDELASWFATYARLNNHRAQSLKDRAFAAIRDGQPASCAVITQLADGCTRLAAIRLSSEEIRVLDPQNVLDPNTPLYESGERRQNEALTNYTKLVHSRSNARRAVETFDELSTLVKTLDALSLLERAKLLERLAPLEANETYERAVKVATDQVHDIPHAIVRVALKYGDFMRRNQIVGSRAKAMKLYRLAKSHEANAPWLAEQIENRLNGF